MQLSEYNFDRQTVLRTQSNIRINTMHPSAFLSREYYLPRHCIREYCMKFLFVASIFAGNSFIKKFSKLTYMYFKNFNYCIDRLSKFGECIDSKQYFASPMFLSQHTCEACGQPMPKEKKTQYSERDLNFHV